MHLWGRTLCSQLSQIFLEKAQIYFHIHARKWICILKWYNSINITFTSTFMLMLVSKFGLEGEPDCLQKELIKQFENAIIVIFYNNIMLSIYKHLHRSIKPQNFPDLSDHCNLLKIVATTFSILLVFSDLSGNTFCYKTPTDCHSLYSCFQL